MGETHWALATVRDENDELRSEWIEVMDGPRPYAGEQSFGERFRKERTRLRVSLAEFGRVMGYRADVISGIERGRYSPPIPAQQKVWWSTLRELAGMEGQR